LYKAFSEVEGKFMFAKNIIASSVEEIQTFLDESVKGTGSDKAVTGVL
jgi:hypothetical protein